MENRYRILVIQRDPCVRAYKQAVALKKRGHIIDLACESITSQESIKKVLNNIYPYDNLLELEKFVRTGNWDIIHSHNEPNEPTAAALNGAEGSPVVYDCHDYRGLRQKLPLEEDLIERRCFEETHGVIHVSQGMKKVSEERYTPKKQIVLPSYPLISEQPRVHYNKLPGNHVVYQGGLLDDGIIPFEYRNYYPFFKLLTDNKVHVHAYAASYNPRVLKTYIKLDEDSNYFHLYKPLPYGDLLAEMSRYHWGLAGFNVEDIHDENRLRFLNNALPNKLFDYLFSGVCPIVINNATAGAWVEDNKVGYYAHFKTDLVNTILNKVPYPKFENLELIGMENNIQYLENFYQEILNDLSISRH